MEHTVPVDATTPTAAKALETPFGRAWTAYVADPNGGTLKALLSASTIASRPALLGSIASLFHESSAWRVAQHLALLHLDRLSPEAGRSDLVRAVYFAHRACALSGQDPRARIVMARVSWERRLPLAVLHDTGVVLDGTSRIQTELGEHRLRALEGEAFVLEGMARAYLRDPRAARERMIQAELRGCLTVEAVVQLLLAAEPGSPDVSVWAAVRIPPSLQLGGRAAALLKRAHRRRLVSTLEARPRKLP
jgi:hypothetical protein